MELERRSVLQLGGVVAVGGLVAACGSGTSSSESSAPQQASAGAAGPAGTASLAKTTDIPVGGGVVVADKGVVVTQPTAGEFKAFSATCPHRGCAVSEVKDNQIICPCHGSTFSARDGAVITGPATSPLAATAVTVEGGSIVLTA
jgi:Rieske Fe-S protein